MNTKLAGRGIINYAKANALIEELKNSNDSYCWWIDENDMMDLIHQGMDLTDIAAYLTDRESNVIVSITEVFAYACYWGII